MRKIKPDSNLRKIQVNDLLRRIIVQNGRSLSGLAGSSPTTLPSDQREVTPFILNRLFPGDPLLCVAKTIEEALTLRKQELIKPFLYSHIVPSPMSKLTGINQSGERSRRCLDNTGHRHYLIIEFDLPIESESIDSTDREFVKWATEAGKTPHDVSAALLLHLSKAAPLVAVVDSGNKSLHGWFNVRGWNDKDVLRFMALAVRLGADSATYTKCQLVRMPGGVRRRADSEPESYQEVLYFDESKCVKLAEGTKNG